ncbi:hypothetical protein [Undibacterium umbellatum]|uniref:Uncharacterized protein n=2 Tax=Undibacterium TaxID=401469 RepID=A0ABR6ZEH7_9BURK|nr:hypothetical protein [Undibacterium umbellatum]MBC3910128.1 hypothetical protein [Undibacterium umbellatum]
MDINRHIRTCFQLLCLVTNLFLASHAFAMLPPATTASPAENNNSSHPHLVNDLTVLMVNIHDQSSHAGSTNEHPFTPYQGILARTPYLNWIIMLCACLLPLGMLVTTVITVIDFRKNRSDDETATLIALAS